MKKTLLLATLIFLTGIAFAQHPKHERYERRPDITELVSDLSSAQKRKLETITNESKQRVDPLRNRQKAVRDSIETLMDKEGDQTKALFPLFDREARIQAEISREMYSTKVRIDEVLTKEQRQQLKKNTPRRHMKKKK